MIPVQPMIIAIATAGGIMIKAFRWRQGMRKEKRREGASSETLLLGTPFYCLPASTFITFQPRPPLYDCCLCHL